MLALGLMQGEDIGGCIIVVHAHVVTQELVTGYHQQAVAVTVELSAQGRQQRQAFVAPLVVIGYHARSHIRIRKSALSYPIGINRSGQSPFGSRPSVQYDPSTCLLAEIGFSAGKRIAIKTVRTLVSRSDTNTESSAGGFVVRSLCPHRVGRSITDQRTDCA